MLTLVLALQVIAQPSASPKVQPCDERALAHETASAQRVVQGHDLEAVLGDATSPTKDWIGDWCLNLRLMRWALIGWTSARALAPKGGAIELVGPTRKIVDEDLATLRSGDLGLEVEYAQTAIRAAIAAAQDERPEMELLLAHARDLTERLVTRGRRPLWPRPFNLMAGELWFEVDRYQEAVEAFERATAADPSPLAWAGLARAYAQLGNRASACAAYRAVGAAAPKLVDEAKAFLRSCP